MANLQTPATMNDNPVAVFRNQLNSMGGEIQTLLPKEVSLEKFKRVTMTAIQENPELLAADPKTLFSSCLKCAKDGLVPDGQEAAFVIYNTNVAKKGQPDKWIKSVSYLPMVKGIKKRLYQYGDVVKVISHCVYENDEFDFELGDNEFIKHKPNFSNRGEQIGVYAIFKMKDGEVMRAVMNMQDINRHRAAGKGKDGNYWNNWFDEMSKKTVIRHLAKNININIDSEYDADNIPASPSMPNETYPRLATPETPTQIEAPKEEIPMAEVVNQETGEITEVPQEPIYKQKQENPPAAAKKLNAPAGADPF